MAQISCLQCRGSRVVPGDLRVKTVGCNFCPEEVRLFKLSLDSPYISLQANHSYLCADCGLVWTAVTDLNEALEKLASWGIDDLKARLGLP